MTTKKTPKAKAKAAKAAARKPVTYTRELGLKICEEVAMRRPLAEVCAEPGMPSERTVYTWRRSHPVFAADYEEARKWRAEARADFIDGIAQRLEVKGSTPKPQGRSSILKGGRRQRKRPVATPTRR